MEELQKQRYQGLNEYPTFFSIRWETGTCIHNLVVVANSSAHPVQRCTDGVSKIDGPQTQLDENSRMLLSAVP